MKIKQLAIIPVGLTTIEDIVEVSIIEPEAWLSEALLKAVEEAISSQTFVSPRRFRKALGDVLCTMGAYKKVEGVHEALDYHRLFVKESVAYNQEYEMDMTQWQIGYMLTASMKGELNV